MTDDGPIHYISMFGGEAADSYAIIDVLDKNGDIVMIVRDSINQRAELKMTAEQAEDFGCKTKAAANRSRVKRQRKEGGS